jgi:ABC-type sugar transport system ATPase subunit
LENKRVNATLSRKETALNLLESEVGSLNAKMEGMVKELLISRGASGDDEDNPTVKVASLEKEKSALSIELAAAQAEVNSLCATLKAVRLEANTALFEACEAKEKLALIDVASKSDERTQRCAQVLAQIQSIWKAVGVTSGKRVEVEHAIDNCLEDACAPFSYKNKARTKSNEWSRS